MNSAFHTFCCVEIKHAYNFLTSHCYIFISSLCDSNLWHLNFPSHPALCTSKQNPISKQLSWNIFRSGYIRFVSKAEQKLFISTILWFLNDTAFTVTSASEKQSFTFMFLFVLLKRLSFALLVRGIASLFFLNNTPFLRSWKYKTKRCIDFPLIFHIFEQVFKFPYASDVSVESSEARELTAFSQSFRLYHADTSQQNYCVRICLGGIYKYCLATLFSAFDIKIRGFPSFSIHLNVCE